MKVYIAYIGVAENYDHTDFLTDVAVFFHREDAEAFIKNNTLNNCSDYIHKWVVEKVVQ